VKEQVMPSPFPVMTPEVRASKEAQSLFGAGLDRNDPTSPTDTT
jgi:hypothetical protein